MAKENNTPQAPQRRPLPWWFWPFYLTTLGCLLWFQFFAPRPAPTPEQTKPVLEQARTLEQDGRTGEPGEALADRKKKLEQAIGKYEEFYNLNKKSEEAAKVRFQQVNIYDFLAQLEGKSSNTHWYDQAEGKLKDMETALLGRQGTVTIEHKGETREVTGDLGKIATNRLDQIRADRDALRSGMLTYKALDFFVRLTGGNPNYSYALALLIIVLLLKILTFPFQKKQYQYQRDMMRIQPKIKALQEELKEKNRPPDEVNRRIFQLYKEENVNLAGGCLPMLVMMVVLFPVFYMVQHYEYQFTNGKFFWIGSPMSENLWWIADNLAQFDMPLFIIYLLSTVGYSLLQPKPADPQQAQQQKMMLIMMPIMFGVMMFWYKWSSAFMLYWLFLNLVSMYQSWVLMKQFGLATHGADAPGSGGGGGGGSEEPKAPVTPLEPMKGVQVKKANGRNGRNGRPAPDGTPGRIKPRGSGRRG